jgi:hypothetical protein
MVVDLITKFKWDTRWVISKVLEAATGVKVSCVCKPERGYKCRNKILI